MRTRSAFLMCLVISWLVAIFFASLSAQSSRGHSKLSDTFQRNNSDDDVCFFMQLTDTHISAFEEPQRVDDLLQLCEEFVSVINPLVVVHTGDITDARKWDRWGSEQISWEWSQYSRVLRHCFEQVESRWLDLRGNHDNFDLWHLDSPNNLYQFHASLGANFTRRRTLQLIIAEPVTNRRLAFNLFDACPRPGLRRPFSFYGQADEGLIEEIEKLQRDSVGSTSLWFGHYPLATIISDDSERLYASLRGSLAYFCGHLHSAFGLVPNMFAFHSESGVLELELSDWKRQRTARIAAIDNGLLSIVDFSMSNAAWPLIVISNPADALFYVPHAASPLTIARSHNIRVLVFSERGVSLVSVRARLDNQKEWIILRRYKRSKFTANKSHDAPMFFSKWNPAELSGGLHTILVVAQDENQRVSRRQQYFSIDGTSLDDFSLGARFLLRSDYASLLATLFVVLVTASLFPLLWARYQLFCFADAIPVYQRLVASNRRFYTLVSLHVISAVGPMYVGEMVSGYYGVVFPWGVLIGCKVHLDYFTLSSAAYVFIRLLIPGAWFLARSCQRRYDFLRGVGKPRSRSSRCLVAVGVTMMALMALQQAVFSWLAYGPTTVFAGPAILYNLLVYVWMYRSISSECDLANFRLSANQRRCGRRHRPPIAGDQNETIALQ